MTPQTAARAILADLEHRGGFGDVFRRIEPATIERMAECWASIIGGVDQWQPIESAPKDGEWILLLTGGEVHQARWSDEAPGDEYEPGLLAGWTAPTIQSFNDHGLNAHGWQCLPLPPTRPE